MTEQPPEKPVDEPAPPAGPAFLPQDPAYGAPGQGYAAPGQGQGYGASGYANPYGSPGYGAPGPYGTPAYGAPGPYGDPGYGPPGYGAPGYGNAGYYGPGYPRPYMENGITSSDDTTWSLLGYLGQLVLGFIAPLIVYASRRNQSPFCRFHGAQALNMALTNLIVLVGGIILSIATVGFGLIIALPAMLIFSITGFIFMIIAAVKSSQRELYKVPKWLAWPMIK